MAAAVARSTDFEMANVSPRPAEKAGREILYTRAGIVLTCAATAVVMILMGNLFREHFHSGATRLWFEDALFLTTLQVFAYGNLVYLASRFGYFKRLQLHRPATRDELERVYDGRARSVAVLIPSYREELRVIRQTIISAALMEYPDKRITLLIDDPPEPSDPLAMAHLCATRNLPQEIEAMFRDREERYLRELADFEARFSSGAIDLKHEADALAARYSEIGAWLESQAAEHEVIDHTDILYLRRVLREPARAHRARAQEIETLAAGGSLDLHRIRHEYRRLASLFAVRITSFERKRIDNLSHTSNKAMNLNSYLALMGRSFRRVVRPGGLFLEECPSETADFQVPHADYIITVDADSLLLNDYALRLIYIMDQPQSQRFAVVQSPYTAVPGSSSILERAAGAQTDVGWIMSQGYRYFRAAFWVGANALLRREALDDICQVTFERGHPVRRYVQDRTLVEDTESTIDLVSRGWELYNYPERLSYSATPPDFGSLVIQRRRWANGGLLILPNLFRYLARADDRMSRIGEALFRLHYLAAPTAMNLAMLVLLCLPFKETNIPAAWLIIIALPYYTIYARDIIQCGYRWIDLPRIYALNLLLIPVCLGGVAHSLRQLWTGRVSAFARTPKVRGRIAAPRLYALIAVFLPIWAITIGLVDVKDHRWLFAAYAFFNASFLAYGLVGLIGVRSAWQDMLTASKA